METDVIFRAKNSTSCYSINCWLNNVVSTRLSWLNNVVHYCFNNVVGTEENKNKLVHYCFNNGCWNRGKQEQACSLLLSLLLNLVNKLQQY